MAAGACYQNDKNQVFSCLFSVKDVVTKCGLTEIPFLLIIPKS